VKYEEITVGRKLYFFKLMEAKLSAESLPPEWSRLLHRALVMKKEIDNPATQTFIQR